MAPSVQTKKGGKAVKTTSHKFVIDFTKPASEGLIDSAAFARFLTEAIKVDGKTGQLTDAVEITSTASAITVSTSIHFSKRALKYLSKKFIKQIKMGEYFRVVSTSENVYELKFRKEIDVAE